MRVQVGRGIQLVAEREGDAIARTHAESGAGQAPVVRERPHG